MRPKILRIKNKLLESIGSLFVPYDLFELTKDVVMTYEYTGDPYCEYFL